MGERGRVRGARREGCAAAQMGGDFHERALDDILRLSDVGDMGLETSYTSGETE